MLCEPSGDGGRRLKTYGDFPLHEAAMGDSAIIVREPQSLERVGPFGPTHSGST